MVDIRLITILPPQPIIAQPQVAQQATTQGTSILAQLPTGSLLSGFIINRDGAGNPILRTEKGDVLFTSNLFLKIGAEVVIRVQNNAGKSSANIVSVNGQTPETIAAQQTSPDENQDVISNRQTAPNSPANTASTAAKLPTIGATLSAIITTPTYNAQAANLPELPPGTALLLTVEGGEAYTNRPGAASPANQLLATLTPNNALLPEDVGLDAAIFSGAKTAPAATATTTLQPSATLPAPTPTNTPTVKLPSQLAIPTAQTATIAASNVQAASAQISAPLGQNLIATVLPNTSNEPTTLLQTSLGVVRVAQAINMGAGTQLQLRVASVSAPNSYTITLANSTPTLPLAPLSELSGKWDSLQQILHVLGEGNTAQGASALANLPSVSTDVFKPTTLGNQTLFFLSALKGGDFEGWIGKTAIRKLEDKGYSSLVRKAEGEFMSIARQWAEVAQPNQWQSLYLPMVIQGEVQQVRAFVKRDKKKNEEGEEENAEDTRFVLEMDLSQLGALQMDGLVQRKEQSLQFDLVVRSHQPLDAQLEHDISHIFQETAEITGYRGQILFQTTAHFPINPLEETLPHSQDDMLV